MRILVVDDSRTTRKLVRAALEELRDCVREVLEAEDGLEALGLLRNEKLEIDAALVDWNMPRLDGLGFLKQFRALGLSRDVAVVMVTSQAQREHVAEALRWGACDYVVKPFSSPVLHEKIRKIAARAEARRCEETSVLLRVVAAAGKREGGISFLEQLPPDLATELRALGTSSFHADGTTLVRPGQRVDSLHLLVQGEAVVAAPAGETEHRRNGDAFAEDAFLEGSPSRVSVRARTAVQVLSLSRVQVAELVRRRPETGYFLGRLVTRGSRARVPEAGLAGRLETLPIPELVQILNICRKTGCLRLERPEAHAEVYFVDGEIRHASAGELAGEAAFHRVAEWTDATFAFDSGARAPSVSIPGPTMPLLLEAMRILDERRR